MKAHTEKCRLNLPDEKIWSATYRTSTIDVLQYGKHYASYDLLPEPYCLKCAYPSGICMNCSDLYGFNRVYALGVYHKGLPHPQLTSHILDMKQDKEMAEPLTSALECSIKNRYPELTDTEIIIPVPNHKDKVKNKGFNQASVLSDQLGSKMKIKSADILIKIRESSQTGASREQRRINAEGAYLLDSFRAKEIRDKKIIVLDDVFTTGFTLSECSKVLLDGGAREVNCVVLGRTD